MTSANKKMVFQYVLHQGSGSHLLIDLVKQTRVEHVSFRHFLFFQAFILARKDRDARSIVTDYEGERAADVVMKYYDKAGFSPVGDPLDPETVKRYFAKILEAFDGDRVSFSHCTPLSVSDRKEFDDGQVVEWTLEDRDEALRLLEGALEFAGYGFRQIALLRHPVDMFISTIGRSRRSAEEKLRSIDEFMAFVDRQRRERGAAIVRYEDICTGREGVIDGLLKALDCGPEEAAAVNQAIVHKGGLNRWMSYPRDRTEELAQKFGPWIEAFDYAYPRASAVRRLLYGGGQRLRIWQSEIETIDRICSGDYSVDGAFSRHHRSYFGRAYFRSKLLVRSHKANVDKYYRTRGSGRSPITPPLTALRNLVGDLTGAFHRETRSER